MKVKVNGKEINIKENTTVEELLNELKILDKTMAAAVNMSIVKKEKWNSFILKENDKVEFLNFVGGG